MAIIRTDQHFVSWAQEATYGTVPQTGWQEFGLFDTLITPDPVMSWTPIYGTHILQRKYIAKGKQSFHGSLPNVRLTNPQPPILLPFSLDNHVNLTKGDMSGLPSFSMNAVMYNTDGNIGFGRTWYGGKVNQATISAKEGEELKYSFDDMIFKGMTDTRTSNVRFNPVIAPNPGRLNYGRFLFSGASIVAFGLVIARVKSFQLDINNNLVEWYGISTNYDGNQGYSPLRILDGKTEYKLTLELDVVDPATDLLFWDYLVNQGGNPVIGLSIGLQFVGDTAITITCSVNPISTSPGTVFESVNIPMNVTNGGYYGATVVANVDYVNIQLNQLS